MSLLISDIIDHPVFWFSSYFDACIHVACGMIFPCAENFRQKFYLEQVLLMLNYQMNTQSVETCLGQSYPKNNIRDIGSTPLYTAYTVYNAQTVTCMPTYIVLKNGGPTY